MPMEWYNLCYTAPYPLRQSTLLRLAGLGFKASSRPGFSRKHGKRARRLLGMRLHGCLPFNLWLMVLVNQVIEPHILGRVIQFLREHFAPSDLVVPPDQPFFTDDVMDLCEWSLYHGWMKMFLKYEKWYCQVALDPCVTVDAFFAVDLRRIPILGQRMTSLSLISRVVSRAYLFAFWFLPISLSNKGGNGFGSWFLESGC